MKLVLACLVVLACISTEVQAKDVLIPADKVAAKGDARFFLVAIGTNRYDDKFWPDLKWAVRDAQKIAKSFGARTNEERVVHLITDAGASRKKILATLEKVRRMATPRDIVAFYLSGHGTLALNDDGELEQVAVLHKTNKNRPLATGLSHREVRQWLAGVSASRKLLVFATCHSGVGKSKLSPAIRKLVASNKGTYVPLAEVSEGALVLAASAKGEAAREDDKLQGDIYTHYLVEALTTFDRNRDGMVTAMEAHDYARSRTYAHTRGRQRPTADAKFIGDADIPLRGKRKRSGLPVLEAYDPELAGFEIQVDSGVKGKLPSAFPLATTGSRVGLYTPGGRRVANYRIVADQGDVVTMEDVLRGPPFSVRLGLVSGKWNDERLEDLTGSSRFQDQNFQARYHLGDVSFGLGVYAEQRTEEWQQLLNDKGTGCQIPVEGEPGLPKFAIALRSFL